MPNVSQFQGDLNMLSYSGVFIKTMNLCFFKKLQKETCKPPPPMLYVKFPNCRSSHSKVFLGKDVLKICSKFTVNHPCRSAISINLLCNFIEITLRHGCTHVNLLHIFRTPFYKNTCGWLLLISHDILF